MVSKHIEKRVSLYVEPEMLTALDRDTLRTQQRIISALTSLLQDGIFRRPYKGSEITQDGWLQLCHPVDGVPETIGRATLWWKVIPCHEEGQVNSFYLQHSLDNNPPKRLKSIDNLVEFNPLKQWVRNPEHASLRRALLTQRGGALMVRAARGSGLTSSLAAAVCDWLNASQGECVLVTRNPRRVLNLLQGLHDELDRVIIVSPQDLLQLFLGERLEQEFEVERQRLGLSINDLIQTLDQDDQKLVVKTLAGHPDQAWQRLSQSESLQQLHQWGPSLPCLQSIFHQKLFIFGEPQRNEQALIERSLGHLDIQSQKRVLQLAQDVWNGPLGLPYRAFEATRGINWPWPEARALIWDDCLSSPWCLLYKVLHAADEHMGMSGRRWLLTLAGDLPHTEGSSGARWADIEALVAGALGRTPSRITLRRNERISTSKLHWMATELSNGRQKQSSEKSQVHVGTSKKWQGADLLGVASVIHFSPPTLSVAQQGLLRISLEQKSNEELKTDLVSLIKTCAGTPGARLIDFSERPDQSARALCPHLETELNRLLLNPLEIGSTEMSWLIVYAPRPFVENTWGYSYLNPHIYGSTLKSIWYLLSRSPTPLIWVGPPPPIISSQEVLREEVCQMISRTSPLGGQSFADQLERARGLTVARDFEAAYDAWVSVWGALPHLLNHDDYLTAIEEVQSLSLELFRAAIRNQQWENALALVYSLQRHDLKEETELPEPFLLELTLTFKEQVQEGEEGRSLKNWQQLDSALNTLISLSSFGWSHEVKELLLSTLTRWSSQLLDEKIPQAQLQHKLLELLIKLSMNHSLQLLQEAYTTTPTPTLLTQIAYRILCNSEADALTQSVGETWLRAHLTRWLTYLLDPRRQPPFITLEAATLAVGFSVVAAQAKQWIISQKLSELSHEISAVNGLDPRWSRTLPSTEAQLEDEHCRRRWREQLQHLELNRNQSDIIETFRHNGDLEGLHRYFENEQRKAPDEIDQMLTLFKSLRSMQAHWMALTEEERVSLRNAWEKLDRNAPRQDSISL